MNFEEKKQYQSLLLNTQVQITLFDLSDTFMVSDSNLLVKFSLLSEDFNFLLRYLRQMLSNEVVINEITCPEGEREFKQLKKWERRGFRIG